MQFSCGPRLWLLLPADTRSELSQARSALDSAVASLIWGLLFIGFTVLAWWALPVAVVVVLAMYLYWIRRLLGSNRRDARPPHRRGVE